MSQSLALKTNGMVVVWGAKGSSQGVVPPGLSNVVAISAGYHHNLALKADGTAAAWGVNSESQCDVPAGLSNVVAVAGGGYMVWH